MEFKRIFLLLALMLIGATAHAVTIKSVPFTTKDAGKVIFDHSLHLKQSSIGNNCKACHNVLFDLKKKVRHTMADMEKGKSCGACHGKTAFSIKDCSRCHITKEITYQVKDAGTVTFSHIAHTKQYTCNKCHTKIFGFASSKKRTTMSEMEAGKTCGACHDGKAAFSVKGSCAVCHKT